MYLSETNQIEILIIIEYGNTRRTRKVSEINAQQNKKEIYRK